jgi:hypothetical protein
MKLHLLKMHQLSVPPCKSDIELMQNLKSCMQCNSTVMQYPVVAAFQVHQLVTLTRPLQSKTVEDLASTSYPMQWILTKYNVHPEQEICKNTSQIDGQGDIDHMQVNLSLYGEIGW